MRMRYDGETFDITVTKDRLEKLVHAAVADVHSWVRVPGPGDWRGIFLFGRGIPVAFISEKPGDELAEVTADDS